jgi:hypothetical protein
MSGVVLDVARLKRLGGLDESEHVECVVLEPWEAQFVIDALHISRASAVPLTARALDKVIDALKGAL